MNILHYFLCTNDRGSLTRLVEFTFRKTLRRASLLELFSFDALDPTVRKKSNLSRVLLKREAAGDLDLLSFLVKDCLLWLRWVKL